MNDNRNGRAAMRATIRDAEEWLRRTENADYSKCPVGSDFPQGTRHCVGLLLATLQESKSQRNTNALISSTAGGTIGAVIITIGKLMGWW